MKLDFLKIGKHVFFSLFSLFSLLVSHRTFALSEDEKPKIVELTDYQDIVAYYCSIETGPHFSTCGSPSMRDVSKIAIVHVPMSLAEKINRHIQEAFSKGYYDNLNKMDLFHGHLMNGGPASSYKSWQEYFSDIKAVLYHSQEYTEKWYRSRIPRSFLGWLDRHNKVQPAIELVNEDKLSNSYKNAGTVYDHEIAEALPQVFKGNRARRVVEIESCTEDGFCEKCKTKEEVNLMAREDGRFTSPDGVRFDMFFQCVFR